MKKDKKDKILSNFGASLLIVFGFCFFMFYYFISIFFSALYYTPEEMKADFNIDLNELLSFVVLFLILILLGIIYKRFLKSLGK